MSATSHRKALVIGASRGLGLFLADELARRGWRVIATTRQDVGELPAHAEAWNGQLTVESLEMTSSDQLAALRERLEGEGCRLDLLFVNAAIDRGNLPIHEVSTDMFTDVMITNALSPLRALEALRGLVAPGGTVAVMSSDQGSISRNTEGGYELYKASKAALNQLMRSYATRHAEDGQTKLLIDPGHNRTRLGGPDAPLAPQESIPAVVDVLEAQAGAPGLRFLDRHGKSVPW
ncbi:SDR family NAD(P)-dependent oxidoreductase [Streptomyces netropsis]|uniref:NAD(P)-dependent dehydrogenase (Short-subunit alcohol dehydrogenase family) n=1 Tax=Streptomyces netropsis TaxID=55404 RepID=A0A7W7PH92_STRNE|nr:SDR family NAD(P)-dependent oxidoreductase [Streptomyces netropsis]MBB4888530.1 NAD(P)-dependent dehydrogenase (short-subunit alcohol dehydrogenase family) [Streptomyces netropsis]GGR13182.1 short-chain dehydrogenase [Streptomyces netropsis]